MESARRTPLQLSKDVARENLRLAQGKLSGRWARVSRRRVVYRGAITDCPQSGTPRHGKRAINEQRTTLIFFETQGFQQRTRRGTRGPNKSLGMNLALTQKDHTSTGVDDACVQAEAYPAQLHLLLRIPG